MRSRRVARSYDLNPIATAMVRVIMHAMGKALALVRYTQRHPERHSLRPCLVHDPIRRLQLAPSKLFHGLK